MATSRDLFEFDSQGTTLRASWHEPERVSNYPVVILATGDGPNGSKGLTWTNIRPKLLSRGIGAFLFDFAGLGHSDGLRRELTLPIGVGNLHSVMEQVRAHRGHDPERIGVMGASFGGNVALLAAADLPDIKAVGLKSPCCYLPEAFLSEYGPEAMREWAEAGYLENAGFNYTAVEEALRTSTYAAAERIGVPVRVVHGSADSAVPLRQVTDLMRFLRKGSIYVIEGADHWYAEGDEWERMADNLVEFFAETI